MTFPIGIQSYLLREHGDWRLLMQAPGGPSRTFWSGTWIPRALRRCIMLRPLKGFQGWRPATSSLVKSCLQASCLSFSEDVWQFTTCKDLIFLPTSSAMSKDVQPSWSGRRGATSKGACQNYRNHTPWILVHYPHWHILYISSVPGLIGRCNKQIGRCNKQCGAKSKHKHKHTHFNSQVASPITPASVPKTNSRFSRLDKKNSNKHHTPGDLAMLQKVGKCAYYMCEFSKNKPLWSLMHVKNQWSKFTQAKHKGILQLSPTRLASQFTPRKANGCTVVWCCGPQRSVRCCLTEHAWHAGHVA